MSFSYGSPLWPLFQSIFGVSTSLRNALIRRLTVTTPVHYSGRAGLLCWLSSHSTGNPRQDYAKGMSVSPFSLLYSCLCCFQQLNAINVNVFTPCLLFSKVAFSLSAGMFMSASIRPTYHLPLTGIDEFRELWIIPLFFILISGVSLAVAWLLAFPFRLNRRQRYASVPTFLPIRRSTLLQETLPWLLP